jgi:hypothetical protein
MNAFIEWLKTCEYQLYAIIKKGQSAEAQKELERIKAALELYDEWLAFKQGDRISRS